MGVRRRWRLLGAALVMVLAGTARGTDVFDGPAHAAPSVNDLAGLYVFRSPSNASNTVFALTLGRCPGTATSATFDPDAAIEIRLATRSGDLSAVRDDLTFRITFGAAAGDTTQPVRLRRFHGRTGGTVLASGSTNQNIPITGGGTFRAGLLDDPEFLDFTGMQDLLEDGVGAFPRPIGVAENFFGPNLNVLSVVFEVPSGTIAPNTALLLVWGRIEKDGVQLDRIGRPLTNTLLIPPLPRDAVVPDRRDAFNAAPPSGDRDGFGADVVGVLQSFYGRNQNDSTALRDLFLPDVLVFQLGNPNAFGTFVSDGTGEPSEVQLGNGRRPRDDASDVLLNVLTNGAIPSDNVPDDNAMRITDGNAGTIAAFPYLGAPNVVAQTCTVP